MKITNKTPAEIKAALVLAGVKQSQIAEIAEVTSQQVYNVISKGVVSHKVRKVIADQLGKKLTDIWPEYYIAKMISP